MNFRQIDCACAVARELSFSKAAKSLYLSQSVVSENVSALEAELGVLLFVRDRRSVSLTPAGEYFCSHMESQRRALEETVKKTREISRRGGVEISVGYDGPIAEVWFGRALRSLCEKHPEAIVHIRKEPVSSLTSLLLDGVLDFVVTHSLEVEGVDQLSFRPLQRSRVCAFVPSGHPLAGRDRISVEDLQDEVVLIDCQVDADKTPTRSAWLMRRAGFSFESVRYVANGDSLFTMIEAGMGVYIGGEFCSGYASRFDVAKVDMDIDLPDLDLGIAWKKTGEPAFLDEFARCAKAALKQQDVC